MSLVAASMCSLAAARKSPSSGLIGVPAEKLVDIRGSSGGTLAGIPVSSEVYLRGFLVQSPGKGRCEFSKFIRDAVNIGGVTHGRRKCRAAAAVRE